VPKTGKNQVVARKSNGRFIGCGNPKGRPKLDEELKAYKDMNKRSGISEMAFVQCQG
jgi:hypothetical protein